MNTSSSSAYHSSHLGDAEEGMTQMQQQSISNELGMNTNTGISSAKAKTKAKTSAHRNDKDKDAKVRGLRQSLDRYTKFRPGRPVQSQHNMVRSPLEISSGQAKERDREQYDDKMLRSQGKKHGMFGLGSIVESATYTMRNLIPHRQTRVLLTWFLAIFLVFPMILFWVVLFETIMKHHRGHHGEIVSTRMKHKIAKADAKGGYDSFPVNLPKLDISPDENELNGQVFSPIQPLQPLTNPLTGTLALHDSRDEETSPSERFPPLI